MLDRVFRSENRELAKWMGAGQFRKPCQDAVLPVTGNEVSMGTEDSYHKQEGDLGPGVGQVCCEVKTIKL